MTSSRLIYAPPGKCLSPERRRLAFLRAFFATGPASHACAGVDRDVGTRLLVLMERRRETSHSASHAAAPETPDSANISNDLANTA